MSARHVLFAGAAAALLFAAPAHASLIFDSTTTMTGTGLGAVSTILTIQATGQNMGGSETGSVTWNGSADVTGGADVKTGASQTLTRSIGSLGLTDASQIAVIFHADQPAGGPITLSDLHLVITNSAGTTLFDSGAFTSASFTTTDNGIGSAGAVFELDAAGIAAADAAGAFSDSGNRIGLVATATPGNGGPETLFVAKVTPAVNVPEPASLAILGSGLLGYALLRRRKR